MARTKKLTKITGNKIEGIDAGDGSNGNQSESERNNGKENDLIWSFRTLRPCTTKGQPNGNTTGKKAMVKKSGLTISFGVGRGQNASKRKAPPEEETVEKASTPRKRKRLADEEIAEAFMPSAGNGLYNLRARRGVPFFQKVNVTESNFGKVIGYRVKVYQSGNKKWCTGKIESYDDETKHLRVLYDDGDAAQLNIKKLQFKIEVMPGEAFYLSSQGKPNARTKVMGLDRGLISREDVDEGSSAVGNCKPVGKYPKPKMEAAKMAAKKGSSKLQKSKDSVYKGDGSSVKGLFGNVDTEPEKKHSKPGKGKATEVAEKKISKLERGKVSRNELKDVKEDMLKAAKKRGSKSQKGENIVNGRLEGRKKSGNSRSQKWVDIKVENGDVEESRDFARGRNQLSLSEKFKY